MRVRVACSFRNLPLVLTLSIAAALPSVACTSAVISGRATPDGRPILWKQRDTGTLENILVFYREQPLAYAGVVDLADSTRSQIWMGSNEAGFCIINTASYNLRYPPYEGKMDQEGLFMKRALATCRTLADFERLLEETKGTRGVEANFGVIDAAGGAAYYETSPSSFVKFDANDSSVAPHGYLLRTNFSLSGAPEDGQGYIRYQTASGLLHWAYLSGSLTVDFILQEVTTSLKHSLTGIDLASGALPHTAEDRMMVPFSDFVPRYSTSASMIMQGVRPGESPSWTTLWTVLGSPLTCPVVPVWLGAENAVPPLLLSRGESGAPVNLHSLELKRRLFPLKISEGRHYLNLAPLVNRQGNGILAALRAVNRKIITRSEALRTQIRERGFVGRDLKDFSAWVEQEITMFYRGFAVLP